MAPATREVLPVGRAVRARRRALGYSQAKLAENAGVGLSWVQNVENGRTARPRGRKLQLVARSLGLSVEQLVGGQEPETARRDKDEEQAMRRKIAGYAQVLEGERLNKLYQRARSLTALQEGYSAEHGPAESGPVTDGERAS